MTGRHPVSAIPTWDVAQFLLVIWCFEPSQLQGITSGLLHKTSSSFLHEVPIAQLRLKKKKKSRKSYYKRLVFLHSLQDQLRHDKFPENRYVMRPTLVTKTKQKTCTPKTKRK